MIRKGFHTAETEEEKLAVYRLRYQVYVEEMGRYRATADHERRLLVEPEDEAVRIGAADALGGARGDKVVKALARGADDTAKDVRVHVAFALGKIENSTAVPVLASLLQDESWEVRANAVQALGKYRLPEALEAVRGMLDDPNGSVRAVAESIIGGV